MKTAILTDLKKCIGCEACALACREVNHLDSRASFDVLSADTWAAMQHIKGVNVRRHCMHCLKPACVSACPVGAMEKTDQGPVIYHSEKCMGCRYCMVACPFNVPTYEWSSNLPRVRKCILCYQDFVSKGKQPACTAVCPTGATIFGDRDELIAAAAQRIRQNPERYIDHIYGVKEVGGTSVLYLSSVPFKELGFPKQVGDEVYPELTWQVLSKIPNLISTAGVALVGVWWIINRRMKLAHEDEAHEE